MISSHRPDKIAALDTVPFRASFVIEELVCDEHPRITTTACVALPKADLPYVWAM